MKHSVPQLKLLRSNLVEVDESMTATAVDDEILNFAELRELQLEDLLGDVGAHAVAPHALGRHGRTERQADPLTGDQLEEKGKFSRNLANIVPKPSNLVEHLLNLNYLGYPWRNYTLYRIFKGNFTN